jgi:hypothetical protein
MSKFIIEPHFRLQDWIAHDNGYFTDEGLDYEFRETIRSSDGKAHDKGDKQGAMQSIEAGRKADVSCACHWTINVAASKGHGRMWSEVYSVSTAGIFVHPDSKIKTPEDLAGVPISVGYQSGSHYSTVQALEQFIPQDKMNLVYSDGMLFARMDKLIDGTAPAVHLFSGPYYFAEQLGFRKLLDCTFMIGTMIHGNPDPEDLRKFYRALRRAQRELDLRPEKYTHYFKTEFPERYHSKMDTRRWGPGERLVFEPYSKDAFDSAREWIASHGIFPDGNLGAGGYETATVSVT